jgi:hypothetical protein
VHEQTPIRLFWRTSSHSACFVARYELHVSSGSAIAHGSVRR